MSARAWATVAELAVGLAMVLTAILLSLKASKAPKSQGRADAGCLIVGMGLIGGVVAWHGAQTLHALAGAK